MKQKLCSKGYSCGLTCINRERSCSKELTGQSVQLCSQLTNLISDQPSIQKRKTSKHDVLSAKAVNDIGYREEELMVMLGGDEIYAKEIYDAINEFTGIKHGKTREADSGQESHKKDARRAQILNEYLAKAPIYSGQIYRGIKNATFDIGAIFELDAMSSFSSKLEVANSFATSQTDMTPVILSVADNKSGCSIQQMSRRPYEDEVLVPRGTRYRVSDKIEMAGVIQYNLEEIK